MNRQHLFPPGTEWAVVDTQTETTTAVDGRYWLMAAERKRLNDSDVDGRYVLIGKLSPS